jgi:hypothetical protein
LVSGESDAGPNALILSQRYVSDIIFCIALIFPEKLLLYKASISRFDKPARGVIGPEQTNVMMRKVGNTTTRKFIFEKLQRSNGSESRK